MKFYKNNAYPDIFLHDCQFRMVYENQKILLLFDNGFCKKEEDCIEKIKGYIQISDISLDDVMIRVYKGKSRFDKYIETVTNIDFSELSRLLQKCSLEIVDEYYCWGQVLYKCCVYPYQAGLGFNQVEILIAYDDRTLEYYIEEDSKE